MQRCQPFIIKLENEWSMSMTPDLHTTPKRVPIKRIQASSSALHDHIKNPNDLDIIKSYENSVSFDYKKFNNDDISNQLKDHYQYNIKLSKLIDSDVRELTDISRQLERLSLCVKQSKYTLCILYDKYICTMDTRGIPSMYKCNIKISEKRKFNVVCDLEELFANIDQVWDDVHQIINGVGEILNINMNKNIDNIRGMIKLHDKIIKPILNTPKVKQDLLRKHNHLTHLVNNTNMGPERIKIETDCVQSSDTINNLVLATDKILFDNIVMYNTIVKNYEILESILSRIK
jgi:predicted DNA-binding protein YlxM (UPF0122 family)